MDVKGTVRMAVAGLVLTLWSPWCSARANRSSYDPVAQPRSPKPNDSFFNVTMKAINSCDTDYGQRLDEDRRIVVEATIGNAYFWSNLVSLGLLGFLFTIIIYQHKVQARREWTTAEVLAQYEDSLSLANAQAEEATRRNYSLMEALTLQRELALRSASPPVDVADRYRAVAPRSRTASTQLLPKSPTKDKSSGPTPARAASEATGTQPADQIGLFKPDVDLVLKVNSPEQQRGRSRDEAKLARCRLNDADQRVPGEQQKNCTLKGE
jgi:hypothetical protein